MRRNRQAGSAHAVVIIVLIAALLFALGWIFWQNFILKQPRVNDDKPVVVKEKSVTPTSVPHSDVKYLTVSEWGVKFPYTGNDTLTYHYDSTTPEFISVSSDSLAASGAVCKQDSEGAGGIQRGTAQEVVPGGFGSEKTFAQMYQSNSSTMGKQGNYYYQFVHDNGTCTDNNDLQSSMNDLTASIVPKVQSN